MLLISQASTDCMEAPAADRGDRHPDAVPAVRVGAQAHGLPPVGEQLDDAFVDEDAQVEKLPFGELERGGLGGPRQHFRREGAVGVVDHEGVPLPAVVPRILRQPPFPEIADRGVLLAAGGAQHLDPQLAGAARIERERQLQGVPLDPGQQELPVGEQRGFLQAPVLAALPLYRRRRLDPQGPVGVQGQPPHQGHDVVPAFGVAPLVDVVDQQNAAVAVGKSRRGVDAAVAQRSEVEAAVAAGPEAAAQPVVVADQVLGAALVAGEQQDVPVADRPEVGDGPVLTRGGEDVVLDETPQVDPALEVLRVEQELRHAAVLEDRAVDVAAGERVVAVFLAPDAGIADAVGVARGIRLDAGYDRLAGQLLPVEQQGVGGDGDHGALVDAVVAGEDAVLLDQGGAAEALVLRVGVDGQRQVAPVHEVVAAGVAPVLADVLGRVRLVEEVVAAPPVAEPVRVVEVALGVDVVVDGPVRVAGEPLPRGLEPLQQRIGFELFELLFEGGRVGPLRDLGAAVGHLPCLLVGNRGILHAPQTLGTTRSGALRAGRLGVRLSIRLCDGTRG